MPSAILPLIIEKKTKNKISVSMDRHGLERLADSLGLFNPAFLKSLDRAEADIKAGRVEKLRSLRDLRTRP